MKVVHDVVVSPLEAIQSLLTVAQHVAEGAGGERADTLPQSDANDLLLDALKSGNAETVQVVLALRDVSLENLELALTRGRADVVNLFGLGEDFLRDTASITQSYNVKHTKFLINPMHD